MVERYRGGIGRRPVGLRAVVASDVFVVGFSYFVNGCALDHLTTEFAQFTRFVGAATEERILEPPPRHRFLKALIRHFYAEPHPFD